MFMGRGDVTDNEWERLRPHLPKTASGTGVGRAIAR